MRKLTLFAHTSLDGVISPGAPDDDSDYANGEWTAPYRGAAGATAVAEAQGARFDLLLGRRTYDLWARFWPTVTTGPFAAGINGATKYVATHRPESLGWGPAEGLGADFVAGVRRVKATDGPDLVAWGSTTLTPTLFQDGLVDELVLLVYPVLHGRGKRFFADSAPARQLTLVSTKAFPSGVMMNTYRHVGLLRAPTADAPHPTAHAAHDLPMTADRIEKRVTLRAPIDRVWQAVSDSKELGAWFGVRFDGPFTAGGRSTGTITPTEVDPEVARLQEPHAGKAFSLIVDRIEPPKLFSFRWHPFAIDPGVDYEAEPATLVTFALQEVPGGTHLTITESGFEALPAARRAAALAANDGGWTMQARLVTKYLASKG